VRKRNVAQSKNQIEAQKTPKKIRVLRTDIHCGGRRGTTNEGDNLIQFSIQNHFAPKLPNSNQMCEPAD
jgi:hypothetical protein